MASVAAAGNQIGGSVNTVRTNTEQVRQQVPWYAQRQNKMHFDGGLRYHPFLDGKCEGENSSFTKLVTRSNRTYGGDTETTIVWSEEMKEVALVLAGKRLTRIQSSFRKVYRGKLLRSALVCTIPTFFHGTNRACLTTDLYRGDHTNPHVDDIMELSENAEAYEFYYRNFLKCVIPPTTFKRCLKQGPTSLGSKVDTLSTSKKDAKDESLVEFVTEAEETMGLFVLENFNHVWQAQLAEEVQKTGIPLPFPKYTTAKKDILLMQKSHGVEVAKGKRLTSVGTKRWNELSQKVAADRARPERQVWEQELLGEMAAEVAGSRKRPRGAANPVQPSTDKLHIAIPDWMKD
jgi:hypothetical protein